MTPGNAPSGYSPEDIGDLSRNKETSGGL